MAEGRKLAAILAADIVGYSRLTQVDEDRTLARVRALRSDLIDPTIAVHHGRIVKRTGDGAIVEFRSVVDAVACAREVQNAMIDRNAGLPEDQRILFRMGVHVGDVVEESDGDLMGDGVNIAARLEGVAKPGAICLSEDAYRQVKGRLDVKISDLGMTPLKNIAEPVHVYSLEVGSQAGARPSKKVSRAGTSWHWLVLATFAAVAIIVAGAMAWRAGFNNRLFDIAAVEDKLANAPRLSIVVLPFANLSGDPEQDYFADGITDDVTTDLSHMTDSFVIARNTALTYRGKPTDVKQIGRDLGVRYALEGSVRRVGEAITVNAQLISTETGAHIWAERFEGERAKLGQLQVDVVARIANALGAQMDRAESLRAFRERPTNPDAFDLELRARLALIRWDNKGAKDAYEQALKIDPNLARAQAGLAIVLVNLAQYSPGADRDEFFARAETLADQALSTRADDSFFLFAKASVLAMRKQTDAAILEGEAAIKANPNFSAAYGYVGIWKGFIGRAEEGFTDIETAIKLSPHDPLKWQWDQGICFLHLQLAQWDQAITPCLRTLAANPKNPLTHLYLATAYAWLGRDGDAKAEITEALKLFPTATVKSIRALGREFSSNAVALQQFDRQVEGMRKAGLPEQ